ncbi:sensor histidine kinase [Actinokineospora enzanensis]|uniref:sensor histidine kinase n=1 Tax=Actinokineospora enzanensis TaxID=155975 RepID=UPI00036C6111|nr:ATP-binding protein [Actinokineospora enzanensis]
MERKTGGGEPDLSEVPGILTARPDAPAAEAALNRVIAWCAAAMRVAVAVSGGFAAIAGVDPPATADRVWFAVAVNVVWSAVFAWVVLRRGMRGWVLAVEIALTVLLCLVQPWLVSPPLLTGGVSWVDGVTSMTIVISSLAWRPRAAVPAGLGVAAAHLVGTLQAGSGTGAGTMVIYLVQVTAAATLMTVLRKAAALADDALADLRETERVAEVMRARRTDERAHNRKLHDTVLATLTTVGTGGITASSESLRKRAAEDLAVVETLGQTRESDVDVDLRLQLRAAADRAPVAVECDLVPCRVPVRVAVAFAEAAAEALTNVGRHAGVPAARLRQHADRASVWVTVSDDGRGFDPDTVPLHRYGVREGIVGRMRAVDGDAEVTSDATGTRVLLRWPA